MLLKKNTKAGNLGKFGFIIMEIIWRLDLLFSELSNSFLTLLTISLTKVALDKPISSN